MGLPLQLELANTLDASQPGETRTKAAETLARIGRFLILGILGEGGMGQVFSAYDPDLDRKVAIKLVRDLTIGSPIAVARFKQEAQAMAKVSHPNVVHVYETGEYDGRVFIAMELVDGISLAHWQTQRDPAAKNEVARSLRVYLQAAAGLLAAHRCGLLHRDFKPDNALLGKDGRVRVADFGLARVLAGLGSVTEPTGTSSGDALPADSGSRLTQVGSILGTPGYMSPEQVRGVEADERSDQFSFCAALYEALYGQQPFPGTQFEDYARCVLDGQLRPPPPSEVPLVVQEAVLRGLAIDPGARFPSMQELIAALESGLAPESEPLLTRVDRFRLGIGLFVATLCIAVINIVVAKLTRTQHSLARGALTNGVFFCMVATLTRWPPWPVRHRSRYRRMMGWFLILLGSTVLGRVAGLLRGIETNAYYTIEVIALSGLAAVEGLRIGWQHSMLAVPALAYAPWVSVLPNLRILLYNLLLAVTSILSIYLHMRQPATPDTPDSRPEG